VRPPTPYEPPAGVEVVRGDVLDAGLLDQLLGAGTEGILCCLGHKRVNPWNPWSAVPPPHDLLARVAAHLVAALPRHRPQRVVAISSGGVGSSAARTNSLLQWIFTHSSVHIGFVDLEALERTFAQSSLDWIAVRPTRLVEGPPTGRIVGTDWFGLFSRIRRSDVAAWMLDAVAASGPVTDRTPMITAA
jgi:hypothetical protein